MKSHAKQAKAPSAAPTRRRARSLGVSVFVSFALALTFACVLCATPAGASAFPEHTPLPNLAHFTTGGATSAPCGVATDSAGDYYVADSSASGPTPKSITIYGPGGNQIVSFSTATFATGAFCKLAVDSSGRIYAANTLRRVAIRLKPVGGTFPPTSGTAYELDKSLNGNGTLVSSGSNGAASAVAVDPSTQNVYLSSTAGNETQEFLKPAESYKLKCEGKETASLEASASTGEIQSALEAAGVECTTVTVSEASGRIKVVFSGAREKTDIPAIEVIKAGGNETAWQIFNGSASPHVTSFQPNGTPINTIGSGVSGAQYIGVDVYGKNGDVYVTDKAHSKAIVFNNAGNTILAEFNGSDSPAGAFDFSSAFSFPAIAVDQSNGHAYVSDMQAHHVVDEFDGAGNFVSQLAHVPAFEEGNLGNGVAVDNGAGAGKGRIYLTARTEAEANRGVFGFGPLIYGLPLKVTKTGFGAGTIESTPVGIDCGTTCEAEFETGGTVKLTATANPGSVFTAWSGCDAVVGGECEVTLDEAREVSANFDARPVVSGEEASQLTDSSAKLEALVSPKGKATSYRFEYLTEKAWEENGESFSGPNAPSKAPASAVPIGAGIAGVAVTQKLSGLKAATAYRFRVVATSSVGTTEGSPQSFATYSPPDIFSGCPNESMRTGAGAALPDCRAYEQASPVDKNGANVNGSANGFTLAAPDGSAISFINSAGLPGGVGSQDFPSYVAKRGAGGWSTQGLLPDPSTGIEARVRGWTPDFSLVFDQAGSVAQGYGLFARSTAGAALSEAAPYTLPLPDYRYVGASKDASTVVFNTKPEDENAESATLKLTPDAAEGKPNVYAWNRTTGQLRLAGVLPDGTAPLQGSVAEDPDWKEFTYNQDIGAVSEDGSVFFSDADSEGQLYERLNAGEAETPNKDSEGNCVPDPVLACTIHVSATHKTNGKGIEWAPGAHRDSAGPQPAVLRYASPDGSKAIFTSSEKLTNDANTGIEPDSPSIAAAKASDGSEVDTQFIPAFAQELAVDEAGGYVYWSDPSHGRIGRAKLDGTEANDNYIPVGGEPYGIAVVDEGSAKYIFWTDRGELEKGIFGQDIGKAGKGTIGRVDLDGNNMNPTCYSGLDNPRSIAANASYVYWTMPAAPDSTDGDLGRAETGCNPASISLNILIKPLASGDVAVDAGHVYISKLTSFSNSILFQCPPAGGSCATITTVLGTAVAAGIAVDASRIYWTDSTNNRIGRSNLDGTSPEPEFITSAGRPEDLARGGEHLLWTAFQGVQPNPGTDLYEFDRESGELSDLAVDSGSENGMEVQGILGASKDASYVYFAANGVPDQLTGSPNANGEEATSGNCEGTTHHTGFWEAKGTCNLYLAHAGGVTFIARLKADPVSGGEGEPGDGDSLDWIGGTSGGGSGVDFDGKAARVSEDGRTLLFRSQRQLTAYDNEGSECKLASTSGGLHRVPASCPELYLYRAGQPGLLCVTCVPTGAAPRVPARLNSVRPPGFKPPLPARVMARNLSTDGKRVFFDSTDQLVAADTNGQGGCTVEKISRIFSCQDVYEWEAPEEGSCTEASNAYSPLNGGCIYLLSSGKGDQPSFFGDASESGNDVFIFSYDQLVPQDEDHLMDAYDVRVDGGLASQHQVAAVPCEGEACKGAASQAPSSGSPGSSSFSGPGNQSTQRKPPHTRCPKGSRRVLHRGKAHCVKRARHHRRAATNNRRAGR